MWEENNQTFWNDFILLGILEPNQYGFLLLTLILLIFFVAITGNSILILLICLDSHLHTPMYYLLSHLSIMDILYITNVVPKMASDFISGNKSITFVGCGFQLFLSIIFMCSECILLAVMAYDRYVAICRPLHYPILMNHRICARMAAGCWLLGTANSIIHTTYVLHLSFCATRAIDLFFCEVEAMLKLSCVDTSHYEEGVNVSAVIFLIIPFSIILASYGQILRTVFHIKSKEAQKKAISTCSSHLTVVVMYYGPFFFTYIRPKSYHTPSQNKILVVLNTILTPMLNPIIYSLRNKDVSCAFNKIFGNIFMHRK